MHNSKSVVNVFLKYHTLKKDQSRYEKNVKARTTTTAKYLYSDLLVKYHTIPKKGRSKYLPTSYAEK